MAFELRSGLLRLELFCVDVFGERFVDGLVQSGEQLGEGFAGTADQHGQAIMSVGGHGDAANRIEHANRDFAVTNQLRDVGQVCRNDWGVVFDGLLI